MLKTIIIIAAVSAVAQSVSAQEMAIDGRLLFIEQQPEAGPFDHVFSEGGMGGGSGGVRAVPFESVRSVDPTPPGAPVVPAPTALGLGVAAGAAFGVRRRRRD